MPPEPVLLTFGLMAGILASEIVVAAYGREGRRWLIRVLVALLVLDVTHDLAVALAGGG